MRGFCKLSIWALVLLLPGTLWAAQSVRVVSDLGQTEAVFSVTSGTISNIAINLDVPEIAVNQVSLNGVDYDRLTLPTANRLFAGEMDEEGLPDVPILTSLVAIPDLAGVELDIEYSGFDIIDDIDLAPVQPAALESGQEIAPFTIDNQAYSRDEFYPGELATAGEPAIMRDVRLVELALYPVQYNPVRRQLKIYRDLNVRINYTYGDNVVNPKTVSRPFISDGFYPIYKALISNFDQVFSSADVQRGGYVIISKATFIDSLNVLANWKHKKGYTVRIVPTTEIAAGGTPTASQIQTYLRNAYTSWEIPPEYVMIVGDMDNTGTTGIIDYPYSGYDSDHKYACVEGTDYLPELFVARLSIDNMTELRKVIAKIMAYETNPFMGDPGYWLRGLSVAGNVTSGGSPTVSPRLITLWVRSMLLRYGFTQVDTSFRWSSGDSDSRLPGLFNQGVSIISYRGWAGSSGWYCPSFDISNLNALQNTNKIGVMASLVCGTGDFGDECFGETWIRMGASTTSFKGGPCFYGVTDHSTHTKWNNPIMVGYYWGILEEDIYHFAAAAVRGKLNDYLFFPRHHSAGGNVEKYFHTYNMLGDPELDVRTKIPRSMTVEYPAALALGTNNIEISAVDTIGQPIEGAYVTLVKGYGANEEVFKVSRTDANGRVLISFDAPTADTMFVTVSARDYIPYLGHAMISQNDITIGSDTLTVDDDFGGYSSGNGDGAINPGEIIELGVGLKNFGSSIGPNNISAALEAIDSNLALVYDANRHYGDIMPGQTAPPESPYVVYVKPEAKNGDMIRLRLNIMSDTTHSWISLVELPVISPDLSVSSVSFSDIDGRLDPGDSISMIITIRNSGPVAARNITARVISHDDFAAIYSATSNYADIGPDSSISNSSNPMVIKCDAQAFDGRIINLALEVTTDAGYFSIPFNVTAGVITSTDPIGPDSYGYYLIDNTDTSYPACPTYQWVEISPYAGGSGSRIAFPLSTDDDAVPISLPFDITCYGRSYNYALVCINGFIAFDTLRMDMQGHRWSNFDNSQIPALGAPRGLIAPFWDDLQYSGNNGVFQYHDTLSHAFIIEWKGCVHASGSGQGSTETFEMIIFDPNYHLTPTMDSDILYQYQVVTNNDDDNYDGGEAPGLYSTVGLQNIDNNIGLQYTYDNLYTSGAATLAAGRAILVTTRTGRGGISGMIDLQNGGNNQGVTVAASTGQHRITGQSGEYWLQSLPTGMADISVSAPGYFPDTMADIYVVADMTTQGMNFALTACPIPSNLIATDSLLDRINISWNPVTHSYFQGYNIYRSNWQNGEFVKLNSSPLTSPSFSDTNAPSNGVCWYYATAIFEAPAGQAESFASNVESGRILSEVGVGEEDAAIPKEFFLAGNYPNPFNPSTYISFGLPKDAFVRLEVFNLLGQKVKTILSENERAGYKSVVWDGRDSAGKAVASGVYFYRLTTDSDFDQTKKMLLVK